MSKDLLKKKREPREASRLHRVTVSLIIILVAGLSIWGVVSTAEERTSSPGYGSDHGGHRMHEGGPLKAMARHLDLSDEQQAQVQTIVASTMAESKALQTKMGDMREQIIAGIRDNGYQEDEVRLIAESNMPLLVDMAVLRIRAMAEVYEILTPEQKAEADKLMEQGGPGMRGRHGWNFSRGSS
jgi:Spy/CpxP family protein refolding chaperone